VHYDNLPRYNIHTAWVQICRCFKHSWDVGFEMTCFGLLNGWVKASTINICMSRVCRCCVKKCTVYVYLNTNHKNEMSRNLGFRVAWTWFFIRITFMFTVWLVSWRKPGNMTNGLLVSSTKRHLWVHPSGLTGKWFRCLTQKCMFTYIYIYVIYYIYCIYICYIILYIYIYYSILYYIYVYIYIYVFSDTPQVINT